MANYDIAEMFLMETEDRMNIKSFAIQPHSSWMFVEFFKQTIQRLNSPIKPCLATNEFESCVTDCFKDKLLKENLECRLPFMNPSALPLCNTTISAKIARKSYLNIYSNNDIIRDCKCHSPCNQIVYTIFSEYSQTYYLNDVLITKFMVKSNINEIFKQKFVMNFKKLISDVGSILGFFFGISVLSCFELLNIMFYVIDNKIFSK
uniref:Uncharacterized protein n=1 Tax=Strigamia maritima TaxID=126957 RepID=T1IKP3_STRMM